MQEERERVKPHQRTRAKRLALVIAGSLAGILLAEGALRCVMPSESFIHGQEWRHFREHSDIAKQAFVADAELGFHPRLGTSHYDEYGTLILGGHRQDVRKRPGITRVLLLGDSVTARRTIENALRQRYGGAQYEFWNCGVEGYNTYQEVHYYKRFCTPIRPDHVVLTLHNNDFDVTPVAFYDDQGRMAVFCPDRSSVGLNPMLYRFSYLYRVWFRSRVSRRAIHDDRAGAALIESNLAELKQLLQRDGTRLTVFLLPVCRRDAWSAAERNRHRTALAILDRLAIEHYDLEHWLRRALDAGDAVQQSEGDTWHPSQAAATHFVTEAVRDGFAVGKK